MFQLSQAPLMCKFHQRFKFSPQQKFYTNYSIKRSIINPLADTNLKITKTPKNIWEIEELFDLADTGIKNKQITTVENRMWRTRAHRELFGLLSHKCNNLLEGDFNNTVGVSTRTLLGAKGIGKSSALTSFLQLCPSLYGESLVPIYVSYYSIQSDDLLRKNSLGQILFRELNQVGLNVKSEDIHDTLVALRNENRKLLLVVDEIDRLFSCKSDFEYSQRTIGDLTAIAENRFGVSSALICGSSASLPDLVSNKACTNEELRLRFPLVNHVGSMNGSKFEEIRIYTSLPTDSEVINGIIIDEAPSIEARRLIPFLAGTNARQISKLMAALKPHFRKGKVEDGTLGDFVEIIKPINWKDIAQDTYDKKGKFFYEILSALKKKNSKIMDGLMDNNGNFNWEKIVQVNWSEFKPLLYNEVRICHSKIDAHSNQISNSDPKQTRIDLQFLADRSWVVLGDRFEVYPAKFIDVLVHLENTKNNLDKITEEIRSLLRNPTIWLVLSNLLKIYFHTKQ